ncbi:hypothetical protein ACIQ6K_35230, partial [Streptomyces sp. NPDC096354]|uniref:hypothetical protein n=1 Tax=Streptomyces sp. NPDC096354 TaxID=3366088 RepID=UPI00381209CB
MELFAVSDGDAGEERAVGGAVVELSVDAGCVYEGLASLQLVEVVKMRVGPCAQTGRFGAGYAGAVADGESTPLYTTQRDVW